MATRWVHPDPIDWWDDVNHFANWFFLSLGAGALLLRRRLRPLVIAGLVVGFGATLSIFWEIGEYLTFVQENEEELRAAYEDTILDLVFDMTGAFLAATITAFVAQRRERPPRGASPRLDVLVPTSPGGADAGEPLPRPPVLREPPGSGAAR